MQRAGMCTAVSQGPPPQRLLKGLPGRSWVLAWFPEVPVVNVPGKQQEVERLAGWVPPPPPPPPPPPWRRYPRQLLLPPHARAVPSVSLWQPCFGRW